MRILHTSDWHLGASLNQEKRYDEFEKILTSLYDIIAAENISVLLIAGDIFDTGLPSNRAAEMYYRFIASLQKTSIRYIIACAGNHDSASFIEAPKSVLNILHVHAVGKADNNNINDIIIPLQDENGKVCAAICALPYLRDRDIRTAVSGENADSQIVSRQEAIIAFYRKVCSEAERLYPNVPLIATGHFYLAGGKVSSASHVVGDLFNLSIADLPDNVNYYALGHLHTPQYVANNRKFRYSGSLLQMGFNDSNIPKSVTIIDTDNIDAEPEIIELPCHQIMMKISGTLDELFDRIDDLKKEQKSIFIHAENTGAFESNLQHKLNCRCEKSMLKIISSVNHSVNPALLKLRPKGEDLKKLAPIDVFKELLSDCTDEETAELINAFNEITAELNERDTNNQ